jgi:hypothetical protein
MYNGTPVEAPERFNCEMYYVKTALRECMGTLEGQKPLTDLDDERLQSYMNAKH